MRRRRPVIVDGVVHHVTNAENKTFLGRTACKLFFTLGRHDNPIARLAVSAYDSNVDCMTCIVRSGESVLVSMVPKNLPSETVQINAVIHAVRYEEAKRNAGLTLCHVRFTRTGKPWPEGHADAEPVTGPVDCPACLRGGES